MPDCSAVVLCSSGDSARLVSDLPDDECDGVDGGISMNVEALEADLLDLFTDEQVRELNRLKD